MLIIPTIIKLKKYHLNNFYKNHVKNILKCRFLELMVDLGRAGNLHM